MPFQISKAKMRRKLYHTARVSRSTSRLASFHLLVKICPKIVILALNSLSIQRSAGISSMSAAVFSCVHSLSVKSLLWDLWSGALPQKSSRTRIRCWGEEQHRVVWTKTLAFLFVFSHTIHTDSTSRASKSSAEPDTEKTVVFTVYSPWILIVIFMKKMRVVFAQTKLTTNSCGVCFCCFLCLSTKYDASLEKLTSHDCYLNL